VFLRAHTEREERLLALRAEPCTPMRDVLDHLRADHENQRTHLAILHELITQRGVRAESQILAQAHCLAQDLREHMAEEETRVFPLLEQAEERAAPAAASEAEELAGLA
jgi:iron-sulfur cluster repair protein YtfE (RIC family)